MKYRYIAVEGNIGSGKTLLATRLAQQYNAEIILEEFAENPFLAKFYEDANRYAFSLELSFLADRYNQLKEKLANGNLFHDYVVSDYIFDKSKIFAHINLNEDEYTLFQRMSDMLTLNLPKPDLLIYLHAPVSLLQNNITKRGREYEQNIDDSYLEKIQSGYDDFLKHPSQSLLRIDMQRTDFNDDTHFRNLIELLESGTIESKPLSFH